VLAQYLTSVLPADRRRPLDVLRRVGERDRPTEVTEAAHLRVLLLHDEAVSRNAALVDLDALLHEVATTGIHYGSAVYTGEFVTGGVFGLDGIHPTDLGYAIMANAMIDAVNEKFGASIRHVDLGTVATRGRYAAGLPIEAFATRPLVPGLDQVLHELFGRASATLP